MTQTFEFVPADNFGEGIPPQIRNEHLATREQLVEAYTALNEWEAAKGITLTELPPEEG